MKLFWIMFQSQYQIMTLFENQINNHWYGNCCSILEVGPCAFVFIIMNVRLREAFCPDMPDCIVRSGTASVRLWGAVESTYRCPWSGGRLVIAKLGSSQLHCSLRALWFRIWCIQVLRRSGQGTKRRGWCRVPTPTSWMSSVLVRTVPDCLNLCVMSCS